MSRQLNIDQRLPFQQWFDAVSQTPESLNSAKALKEFLEEDFERMSCGAVILDTAVARSSSSTLRGLGPVSEEAIRRYIDYWKSVGVLV
jgi:hypothetical protein